MGILREDHHKPLHREYQTQYLLLFLLLLHIHERNYWGESKKEKGNNNCNEI